MKKWIQNIQTQPKSKGTSPNLPGLPAAHVKDARHSPMHLTGVELIKPSNQPWATGVGLLEDIAASRVTDESHNANADGRQAVSDLNPVPEVTQAAVPMTSAAHLMGTDEVELPIQVPAGVDHDPGLRRIKDPGSPAATEITSEMKNSQQLSEPNNRASTPASTQGSEAPPAIKQEQVSQKLAAATIDSDEPIVVSERSLKRKRANAGRIEGQSTYQPGTFKRPFKVKSEHGSSSPLSLTNIHDNWNDSLDLDEVGRRVETPRKPAKFCQTSAYRPQSFSSKVTAATSKNGSYSEKWRRRPGSSDGPALRTPGGTEKTPAFSGRDRANHNRPSSPLTDLDTLSSRFEPGEVVLTGDEPTSKYRQSDQITIHAEYTTRTPEPSGYRVGLQGNVDSFQLPGYRRLSDFGISGKSPCLSSHNRSAKRDRVLQPMSNNTKVLPRIERLQEPLPGSGKRNKPHSLGFRVGYIAEDGDVYTPAKTPKNEVPPKFLTPDQSKAQATKPHVQQRLDNLLEQPSPSKHWLTPASLGGNAPSTEPLRFKKTDQLTLEHFKVNPNYNQGLNYAFTETVRNKDMRKCLPGCTRSDCCGGAFRKSIEIGGLPTPLKSGLNWDSSQNLNEEDQLLLDYVGDDVDRLRNATGKERRELLLQARTKQFADRHGKHRNAYERRKTPPGFWRTDMPSTQELERDREEARRMDRERVEERYREAMRPGGKWIFRDE